MAVRNHAPVKTCAAKARKREERREGIQKIATPSQLFIFFASSFALSRRISDVARDHARLFSPKRLRARITGNLTR
jgi:hypothetical protein